MSALAFQSASVRLGAKAVLDAVDLRFDGGGLVAVCGPNGAGKSTLLKAAAGVLKPFAGSVRLGDADAWSLNAAERARRISYLAQDRRIAWGVPALSLVALGCLDLEGPESEARAMSGLRAVGLEHLADRSVFEMSGGERARVLLARALASDASVLVLDEPVAGLDPDAQFQVMDLLRARAAAGACVLVTLHDLALAARYAGRAVVLSEGKVVADGPPRDAFSSNVLADVFRVDGRWTGDADDAALVLSRRA